MRGSVYHEGHNPQHVEGTHMDSELIIISDRVFTGFGDEARPLGIAISEGRITETFDPEAVNDFAAVGTEVIDFGDSFVCAGFHDAHQHVLEAALFPSELATEYLGTSELDCVRHMVEFSKGRPRGWLLGHGWRETAWTPGDLPTRHSLDEAFPARPVAMYSGDAHTLWLNSRAMGELGIDETTEPPSGGSFDRDDAGVLTGVVREAAAMLYVSKIMALFSDEELASVYRSYFARLSSMGVTSVCDMALSLIPGADGIRPGVYERLLESGELNVRAHLFPTLSYDLGNLEELQGRLAGDTLRAPGFKQFFDGVSSQHTAWLGEEYEHPRYPGDVGRPTIAPERMRELVLLAAEHGHAVRIHTIGDRAVSEAISIFAEASERFGEPAQGANTLEHIEDIVPEDIARLREAGLVASVQPPHTVIEVEQPERDLGLWRANRMWPFKTMLGAGVTLAFGTDAPVVPPTSTDVLYTALTRKEPETHLPEKGWNPWENVSAAEAIRAYTHGSAKAVGRSHELGLIAPGMLADIVAWDTDLLACAPERVQDARVLATFVGGRCVYEQV